jgi:hypothetical protein
MEKGRDVPVVKEQLIKRYAIKAYGDWMYGSKFS